MAGWGRGPFGHSPWGGTSLTSFTGSLKNSLLIANSQSPNTISMYWSKPENYDTTKELIIVRRKDSFPIELRNIDALFTAKATTSGFTDVTQVQVFRGKTIRGSGTGTTNLFTDLSGLFTTSPKLIGRILRDSTGHNFRILNNTTTTLTVDGTPATGQYVVLVDFPSTNNPEITSTSTAVGASYLEDTTQNFTKDFLMDRILVDSLGSRFVIFSNTSVRLTVSGTPAAGPYIILQEFVDYTSPSNVFQGQFKYIDTFVNSVEAAARVGTGLESDQFYYYTLFTSNLNANVAQAVFGSVNSAKPSQAIALSTSDRDFGTLLYDYWPMVYQLTDKTGDLKDLMSVFGNQFNELYSYVNTFDLTDSGKINYTLLPSLSAQLGMESIKTDIGYDTYRRVVADILPTFNKKGTKLGIVDFIRIVTTWDITNGTKDASSILDNQKNQLALRFHSLDPDVDLTRIFGFEPVFLNSPFISYTYTIGTGLIQFGSAVNLSTVTAGDFFIDGDGSYFDIVSVSDATDSLVIATGQTVNTTAGGNMFKKLGLSDSGRFFESLSGVIIPGFFDFAEYIVTVNNIALFVGESTGIQIISTGSVMEDTLATFGGINNLVGNYLIPKQGQTNDIFLITSNTNTTITVEGTFNDKTAVGDYCILSPLNAKRLQVLIGLMENYSPSFAKMGIKFT
jgi:hypothetical protein